MDNLVVSLRNRKQVAENTLAFHLEKPKGFIFKPGQALDVTLTNPGEPDPEGNTTKPAVFLAGGIGITPFVSILLQATRDKLPHELYLFYSNRRPEDAAFFDDLQRAESQNAKFRMIPTMTQMAKSSHEWKGETAPSTEKCSPSMFRACREPSTT